MKDIISNIEDNQCDKKRRRELSEIHSHAESSCGINVGPNSTYIHKFLLAGLGRQTCQEL